MTNVWKATMEALRLLAKAVAKEKNSIPGQVNLYICVSYVVLLSVGLVGSYANGLLRIVWTAAKLRWTHLPEYPEAPSLTGPQFLWGLAIMAVTALISLRTVTECDLFRKR